MTANLQIVKGVDVPQIEDGLLVTLDHLFPPLNISPSSTMREVFFSGGERKVG